MSLAIERRRELLERLFAAPEDGNENGSELPTAHQKGATGETSSASSLSVLYFPVRQTTAKESYG